jgi:GNAT superfamily N-acetyltransferase
VAIRSDAQRLGHGRTMLSLAEQFARAEGCSRLITHAAPDAVEFYQKSGFAEQEGAGPSAPESVLMTKRLRP